MDLNWKLFGMAFQNAWYHCWIAWQRNGYQIRRCHELTRTKQSFNPMIKLTSPIRVWNKDTNSCYSTPSRMLGLMSVLWITLPALESLIRRLWSTCCMTMIKSNPVSNKALWRYSRIGIQSKIYYSKYTFCSRYSNCLHFVHFTKSIAVLPLFTQCHCQIEQITSKTGSGPKHFRIFVTVQTPL